MGRRRHQARLVDHAARRVEAAEEYEVDVKMQFWMAGLVAARRLLPAAFGVALARAVDRMEQARRSPRAGVRP